MCARPFARTLHAARPRTILNKILLRNGGGCGQQLPHERSHTNTQSQTKSQRRHSFSKSWLAKRANFRSCSIGQAGAISGRSSGCARPAARRSPRSMMSMMMMAMGAIIAGESAVQTSAATSSERSRARSRGLDALLPRARAPCQWPIPTGPSLQMICLVSACHWRPASSWTVLVYTSRAGI